MLEALNCVANGKIEELNLFDKIYIQPASGDAGGAIGCALAINHMYFDNERVFSDQYDLMKGSYLGPYYSNKEIITTNKKHKAVYEYIESFEELTKRVAKLISEGNVVGWFQEVKYGPELIDDLAGPKIRICKKIKSKKNIGKA